MSIGNIPWLYPYRNIHWHAAWTTQKNEKKIWINYEDKTNFSFSFVFECRHECVKGKNHIGPINKEFSIFKTNVMYRNSITVINLIWISLLCKCIARWIGLYGSATDIYWNMAIAETLTMCKYVCTVCILLKWPILYFPPHYTCVSLM